MFASHAGRLTSVENLRKCNMIILMIFFIAQRGEASEQYGQTMPHAAIIHQCEAGSRPWRTSPTERDNNE